MSAPRCESCGLPAEPTNLLVRGRHERPDLCVGALKAALERALEALAAASRIGPRGNISL